MPPEAEALPPEPPSSPDSAAEQATEAQTAEITRVKALDLMRTFISIKQMSTPSGFVQQNDTVRST